VSQSAENRCPICGEVWSGSHTCIHEGGGLAIGQSVTIGPEGVTHHMVELETDDKILLKLERVVDLLERILDEISVYE